MTNEERKVAIIDDIKEHIQDSGLQGKDYCCGILRNLLCDFCRLYNYNLVPSENAMCENVVMPLLDDYEEAVFDIADVDTPFIDARIPAEWKV